MKSFNLRLSEEQSEMLEFLSKSSGMSKNAYIVNLIQAEYDMIQGSPKMKEAYELMKKMNDMLKDITNN